MLAAPLLANIGCGPTCARKVDRAICMIAQAVLAVPHVTTFVWLGGCACRYVMPDNRTIYSTDDGTNGVLTMFKADKPADLTSGGGQTCHDGWATRPAGPLIALDHVQERLGRDITDFACFRNSKLNKHMLVCIRGLLVLLISLSTGTLFAARFSANGNNSWSVSWIELGKSKWMLI